MQIVIYARYSTDNQNPDTIEVQVQKCGQWASDNGHSVIDIFADEGVSGMKADRPKYKEMMKSLLTGKVQAVIIYDQSRMFRDMVEWFLFRRECEKLNVKVISVTQPHVGGDLNDPATFATEGIMALVNQMHVLTTRQKVIEKMEFMARQGIWCGGTPCLGYDVKKEKSQKYGRLVINDVESEIVKLIFNRFTAGHSYKEIILELEAMGAKTKAGRSFGTNSLYSILTNEKYIGIYTYNKSKRSKNGTRNAHAQADDRNIRVENAVPVLIEMEVWNLAQEIIKGRKQSGRPAKNYDYMLLGRIFCGHCGMAMTGESGFNRRYFYYACSGKKRLKNCEQKSMPAEKVEEIVAGAVLDTFRSQEETEKILQHIKAAKEAMETGLPKQIELYSNRLKPLTNKINSLVEVIAEGGASPAVLEKLRSYENEKAEILYQLDKLHELLNVNKDDINEYRKIFASLACLDVHNKKHRKKLCSIPQKVIAYDDQLHIAIGEDEVNIGDISGNLELPTIDGTGGRT